jgi:general secretion pathway protein G
MGACLIKGEFFPSSLKRGRIKLMGKWRALNRGFTLIELMIVVAILGTLSAIAVPLYANQIDKARCIKAIADLRIIEKEIIAFQAENQSLPLNLNQIGRDTLLDPWGNPYRYLNFDTINGNGQMRKDRFLNPLNSDYDLYSMGKDGRTATPLTAAASYDDIIRAVDGRFLGLASDF